jgi:hypothetical protein
MKFEDTEITKVFKDEIKQGPVKYFPVLLKRGYFPCDPNWPKDVMTGAPQKAKAGEKIELPIDEARTIIKAGIAERADEITI